MSAPNGIHWWCNQKHESTKWHRPLSIYHIKFAELPTWGWLLFVRSVLTILWPSGCNLATWSHILSKVISSIRNPFLFTPNQTPFSSWCSSYCSLFCLWLWLIKSSVLAFYGLFFDSADLYADLEPSQDNQIIQAHYVFLKLLWKLDKKTIQYLAFIS